MWREGKLWSQGWDFKWSLKYGVPEKCQPMRGQMLRWDPGVKGLCDSCWADRRTGSGFRCPLPRDAVVLVAVFSSSCTAGLWSLPCLDSSKMLIFEMSFLLYYSIPSKLDQAGKHNTKAQSVCEMKLMAPSSSHVCFAALIKYLPCGLQWINFCINPSLLSFLLVPLLILQHLQNSKQSQKGGGLESIPKFLDILLSCSLYCLTSE